MEWKMSLEMMFEELKGDDIGEVVQIGIHVS